jgi:iron complex transport system substrate-binding protein
VALPATVRKVFAAGPPASIILFALAPEKLAGWTTAWREQEAAFVDPRWAGLPVTGRVTGRGGSANMEDVLRAAPDLILDYGSVSATYRACGGFASVNDATLARPAQAGRGTKGFSTWRM